MQAYREEAGESGGYEEDSDDDQGGYQPGPSRYQQAQQQQLDICYAEEASLLLGELAASHGEAAALLQKLEEAELTPARKASCCIM